jgi:hypothetical protein
MIILGLVLITVTASIPIVENVTKRVNNIPIPTPINVPVSMKNLNKTENSYAGTESTKGYDYNLYFVRLEDNGKTGRKIGCNDSLVPVALRSKSALPLTTQEKLTQLLSNKNSSLDSGALYNALHQSSLTIDRVETDSNGTLKVYIVGSVILGGTCDTPRIIEQITQVAKDDAKNNKADIYLNDRPIQDVLSQK